MKKRLVVTVVFAVFLAEASTYAEATDLFDLAKTGTPQDVQAAIKAGANINARDVDGMTPLMAAAGYNPNPEVIKVLLNAAGPNGGSYEELKARDKVGMTPLMYAASRNENPEVITTLWRAAADPKAKDSAGKTAFDYAKTNAKLKGTDAYRNLAAVYAEMTGFFDLVRTGTPQKIQVAIKSGVDVNAREDPNPLIIPPNGMTPLMLAASSNPNPVVITILLKAGADIEAQTKDGATALMYAAKVNQNADVIMTLLKAGADVNAQDVSGMTPLMDAAWGNHNPEVISTLLKAGADIEIREKNGGGRTALLLAAQNNDNPKVTTTLLKAGADIEAQDEKGKTALMYAAQSNFNPKVVTVLLNSGANAKAQDNAGKAAFDYAQNNGRLRDTDAYFELNKAQY